MLKALGAFLWLTFVFLCYSLAVVLLRQPSTIANLGGLLTAIIACGTFFFVPVYYIITHSKGGPSE